MVIDNEQKRPALGEAGHSTYTNGVTEILRGAEKLGNGISFTVIRNDCRKPLSKSFNLSSDGRLEGTIAAQLTQGTYERVRVDTLDELGTKLDSLEAHECVMFGLPKYKSGKILSKAEFLSLREPAPETVTRTKEHFVYSTDSAVMLLDFDKRPGVDMPEIESLIAAIRKAMPELERADLLAGASTSSNIRLASTGEEIKGVSGFHIQLIVNDGSKIPKIGSWIEDRLWLAGHGWILVSDKGEMLEKTLVDRSVWQGSKLIFSAASCGTGLVQSKAPRVVFNGLVGSNLSFDDLASITEVERKIIDEKKLDARKNALSESIRKRGAWNKRNLDAYKTRHPNATTQEIDDVERGFACGDATVLPPELMLYFTNNISATAKDVYQNIDKYHGKELRDPNEPEYHNNAFVAIAVLKNTACPHIYSQTHHGQKFYFESEEQRLKIIADVFPQLAVAPPPRPIGAKQGTKFQVIKPSQLTNQIHKPDLIKGILPFAEVGMLFGQSAAGKSFLAIDMAASIARGTKFRDCRVQRGNVLYVVCEGSGGFGKRIAAYQKYHQCILDDVGFYVICDAPNLLAETDVNLIIQSVTKNSIWIVVVDTLAQASAGGNENSGEDMGQVLATCRRIYKETGAMVLLVHHSGKDQGKGERGWSGMRAGMDCSIEVTRDADQRFFKLSKLKDGEDGQIFQFSQKIVEIGLDEDGDSITSCVVVHSAEDYVAPSKDINPCGKNQKFIYRTLLDIETINQIKNTTVESLMDRVVLTMKDDGHTAKRGNLKRTIDAMVAKKVLFISGDIISTKCFLVIANM